MSYAERCLLTFQRPLLRTYGKRTTSNNAAVPPTKKRRMAHDDADIVDALSKASEKAESSKQLAKRDELQLPPPTAQQPKKGTILSYFKVRSPSSGTSSACAQSEPVMPSSTPPSSPPSAVASRKRPRRLTTKTFHRIETSTPEVDGEEAAGAQKERQHEPALQDTSATCLNQKRGWEAPGADVGTRGSKRQKSKRATIQTTISLSLDEKQFMECTECNMIYNPYHEADVKLHKRRHAASLRSKRKKNGGQGDKDAE
jgi:hypothetical protein